MVKKFNFSYSKKLLTSQRSLTNILSKNSLLLTGLKWKAYERRLNWLKKAIGR